MISLRAIFFVSIVFALQLPVFANTEAPYGNISRGNVSASGGMSVGTSNTTYPDWGDSTRRSLSIDPSIQYFVLDRFSAGLVVSSDFSWEKRPDGDRKSKSLGLGPIANYYFFTQDKLASYAGASLTNNSFSNSSDSGTQDHSARSVAGWLGINYFITPAVALGPSLTHRITSWEDGYTTKSSFLQANFSLYF